MDSAERNNQILGIFVRNGDIELQLGSYIRTYTNETHSLAPLQDLIPTLAL